MTSPTACGLVPHLYQASLTFVQVRIHTILDLRDSPNGKVKFKDPPQCDFAYESGLLLH